MTLDTTQRFELVLRASLVARAALDLIDDTDPSIVRLHMAELGRQVVELDTKTRGWK